MNMHKSLMVALMVTGSLTLTACKEQGAEQEADAKVEAAASPEAAAPAGGTEVETEVTKYVKDRQLLFDFLKAGEYKSFPVHDEKHTSVGPHDDVNVYFNKVVSDSLTAGNAEHPAGSMIVKEQYKPGESELYGWSVSIKTQATGDAGKGWYWIEFLDKNDITKVFPEEPGNGVPGCAACHTLGKDLIRSEFPKGK